MRSRREMALKNAPGSFAENFYFTLSDGNYSSLYEISLKYLILLFYYPDCSHCRTMIRIMERNKTFNRMIVSGELKILCVYPESDRELWKREAEKIPSTWLNAYDENPYILENSLYNFKSIPSLFLLGSDKKVILKDTDYLEIEDFLNGIK